jgi:hypothetical protein
LVFGVWGALPLVLKKSDQGQCAPKTIHPHCLLQKCDFLIYYRSKYRITPGHIVKTTVTVPHKANMPCNGLWGAGQTHQNLAKIRLI